MSRVSEDWYDGFFEGAWLDYASRDIRPGWTQQTVEFLVERLELRVIELELIQRDMRRLDAVATFDAVLNLFSSFGYFHEQAEDELVVAAVASARVPGGMFFLDTINPVALAAAFPRAGLARVRRRHGPGRRAVVGPTPHLSSWRMLDRAGLEVDGAWGSWDGTELDGRRILLQARKHD